MSEGTRADRLTRDLREAGALVRDAARHWWADNTFQMGAALAYCTVFSLAPILLIALAIASLFFEPTAARRHLLLEINGTVGPQVGQAIEATAALARQGMSPHIPEPEPPVQADAP